MVPEVCVKWVCVIVSRRHDLPCMPIIAVSCHHFPQGYGQVALHEKSYVLVVIK